MNHTTLPRKLLWVLVLGTCYCGLACAQLPTSAPSTAPTTAPAATEPDAIGQQRHLHAYHPPHPRAVDRTRFITNRANTPPLPVPDESPTFTFLVFGDRTSGKPEGLSVLADAVHDANLLEPDFVITVGDMVQGYTHEPIWVQQAKDFKRVMDKLVCPWFPVVGNHDVTWRGPQGTPRPVGQNEGLFETPFGPLWYACAHKNCWFIALFSDEGDPVTGEKGHDKPELQRMSAAQFEWLRDTLAKAHNADHVFVFLHQPRWLKGVYGDDWDHVHELLKSAGNVSAVFAGHYHRMRYEGPQDGIEYIMLATTGGNQDGLVPAAGNLHEYHLVHVRKDAISVAAVPVGKIMDVREITGILAEDCARLARQRPKFSAPLVVQAGAAVDGELQVVLKNPTSRPVECTITPESADSRWVFHPDHVHDTIAAGATLTVPVQVARRAGEVDETWRFAQVAVDVDYLAPVGRYPIPTQHIDVPLDFVEYRKATIGSGEHVLTLNGQDQCLQVPSDKLPLPDGPLTVECWFNAAAYGDRVGLITKTEGSDYGIFVSHAEPAFSVYIGGSYLSVKGKKGSLKTGQWQHIAGVYDGKEARLYVDGELIATAQRSGKRKMNDLPLTIGADVARGEKRAVSYFHGQIDGVRVSKVARYAGERVKPERQPSADGKTVLLLNMDGTFGPWVLDDSGTAAHALLVGTPKFETIQE